MSLKLVQQGRQPTQNFLPLFAMAKPGDPPADPRGEERLDIAELLVVRPDDTFFVRVEGEVADDTSILPGDILVVDRSLTARPGDTVIAHVSGELVIRALPRTLRAIPPGHSNHLEVWGVVLWVVHKVR